MRVILAVWLLLGALPAWADVSVSISSMPDTDAVTVALKSLDPAVTGISIGGSPMVLRVDGPTTLTPTQILSVILANPALNPVNVDAFRANLPTIFAGTPTQQAARYLQVLKLYPPAAVLLFALRGRRVTADQKAVITTIVTDVKALIGTPNQVLTATEYQALQVLAGTYGLGALFP